MRLSPLPTLERDRLGAVPVRSLSFSEVHPNLIFLS
ncbi:conserved hypothetical protein [Thiomonas arsenitoxydans]|uniref:Uncharacterized protein n=1 Tax=Thiomonas arsenitoxydans (strain DSM 22701 / CIP 110005 / 3As) TaxID=426114 RepID=D6CL18_THIA3|nr:hypothetical protein THI_1075 [Thiomonas arsenitoxydans]CDW94657.1 conserved hypothetical protein [Thiomonas sp. CB2]CQR26701.1 conserved hypothetical protein [Thiomonas arsenitoxydans]CQR31766.1 conserved hypothetical protein [Thiomonas arsenitoxydans]